MTEGFISEVSYAIQPMMPTLDEEMVNLLFLEGEKILPSYFAIVKPMEAGGRSEELRNFVYSYSYYMIFVQLYIHHHLLQEQNTILDAGYITEPLMDSMEFHWNKIAGGADVRCMAAEKVASNLKIGVTISNNGKNFAFHFPDRNALDRLNDNVREMTVNLLSNMSNKSYVLCFQEATNLQEVMNTFKDFPQDDLWRKPPFVVGDEPSTAQHTLTIARPLLARDESSLYVDMLMIYKDTYQRTKGEALFEVSLEDGFVRFDKETYKESFSRFLEPFKSFIQRNFYWVYVWVTIWGDYLAMHLLVGIERGIKKKILDRWYPKINFHKFNIHKPIGQYGVWPTYPDKWSVRVNEKGVEAR
ncbi:MAG: hypothetical protein ACPLSP_04465 [Fervidicoccus fontis]